MPAPLQVLVVGPGALGSALADLLEAGGARVTRLGRDGVARPPAPSVDVCLVTVKSHQTQAALENAAPWIGEDSLVLSLQNGLMNAEAIACRFGTGRAAAGATTHAARRLAGGGYVHVARGDTVIAPVAPQDPAARARVERAAARLGEAGLAVEVVQDLEPLVWEKLCVSCSLNPVTALLGLPNGGVLDDPDARALVEEAAGEVARLAARRGLALFGAEPGDAATMAARAAARALEVARRTAANRSSMLQDLEAGRRTEIEALCLAVAERAAAAGLEAPANRLLGRLVRARQARRAAPGAGAETARPAAAAGPRRENTNHAHELTGA